MLCIQARAASAESALRAAQTAAADEAGRVAGLARELEGVRRQLGTAEAAVQAAAERITVASARHAEERAGLEGRLREVQEQLWEAEDKV